MDFGIIDIKERLSEIIKNDIIMLTKKANQSGYPMCTKLRNSILA